MKKPPDKIINVKCNINKIIRDIKFIAPLFDACFRTNKIVIQSYQLLRLWILDHYHNNIDIPIITVDTIKMIFNVLTLNTKGGNTPKGNNLILLNNLTNFYNSNFKDLCDDKVNGSYLSQILNYTAVDMLTNIENNVKMHFFKYVNRFVNSSFKIINDNILENTKKGNKVNTRKQLNNELFQIKQDLFNNTLLSNSKYHNWINQHRNNIFPIDFINSYDFDIQTNPQRYFKSMIYMCLEIEKIGTTSYQFCPLRTDIIPKYIPIDTKSLIEIFIRENKKELLDNIEENKFSLWNTFFNLNDPIFEQSNYTFDFRIYTDCYAVSIQMLNKNNIESEKNKKNNMKIKRNEIREKTKDMTQEEKDNFRKQKEQEKKKEQDKYKLEQKEKKDKAKEEFKKLSKEEQLKIKEELKKNKEEKKLNNGTDFKYLEDLDNEELEEIKNNNWVVIDPGKKTLLYMKDKSGKELKYTNRKHTKKTKRIKYQKLLQNHRDKTNVSNIENELKKYNSRSCNLEKFKEYILNKNKINNILYEEYNKEIFRKYKWYGYINRKKADVNLIRDIKRTFGKQSILLYGDWSMKGNCNKGNLSTPNMRLKRLIGEQIKTYNLDEYNTSKLNHKTEEVCDNLYLPDKKWKIRKLHSVLTYKMENKQIGCINRDKNAVYNMLKIVNYYIIHKRRPEKYCRTIKGLNPFITSLPTILSTTSSTTKLLSNISSTNINEQDTTNIQGQVKPCLP
jgi:hypothetical protein